MDTLTVKTAVKEDSEIILSFIKGLAEHVNQLDHVTATVEEIEDTLFATDSAATAKIAYKDSVPAGFVLYFKTYSTFSAKLGYFIEDLFVSPEFRGYGIGTALLNEVFSLGKVEASSKVEWYVNNANTSAIDFYEKIGARKLDYKSILYVNPAELEIKQNQSSHTTPASAPR